MIAPSRLLHALFGDYAIYRIYECRAEHVTTAAPPRLVVERLQDPAALIGHVDSDLRDLASYAGENATGFCVRIDGVIAAACWFWEGARYARERGFWPLEPGEAKLVQITTARGYRGRGIGTELIRQSAWQMIQLGRRKLYARVWHSNRPSRAAFEKAGWREIALAVHVLLLGRWPLRWVRPRRRAGV